MMLRSLSKVPTKRWVLKKVLNMLSMMGKVQQALLVAVSTAGMMLEILETGSSARVGDPPPGVSLDCDKTQLRVVTNTSVCQV